MNGEINRSATKDEIIKMQNILENALIEVQLDCQLVLRILLLMTHQLKKLLSCKSIKKHDGIFTTHMRNEGDNLVSL